MSFAYLRGGLGGMKARKLISIVTPVFNEEQAIIAFINEVESVFEESLSKFDYEIIVCLDPSSDNTEHIVVDAHTRNHSVKLLRFASRIGQDKAVLAGLDFASGDAVIVMDCDLQDPPGLIPKMIEEWQKGSPVVLAQRIARFGESRIKHLVSRLFYRFMNKFSFIQMRSDTGEFRLLDHEIVVRVRQFRETNAFLKGILTIVTSDFALVPYERQERAQGVTKYNKFLGGYKVALTGIINFSNVLLRASIYTGLIFSALSFTIAVTYVGLKLAGARFPEGNTIIVFSVFFTSGLNLLGIGILGLYLDKVYVQVKSRPRYIIERELGF